MQRCVQSLPMIGYARWNAYWSVDKLANSLFRFQRPPFGEFGSYLIDRDLNPEKPRSTVVPDRTDFNLAVLDETVKSCEAEQANVLLFTAPWLDRRSRGGWETLKTQFGSRGVSYRDFGDTYRNRDEYFYDASHLNTDGARAFTNELIDFISLAGDQEGM